MSDRLLLESAYHWEATTPDRVWMTQPLGGDRVQTYTWAQALEQARRMASYLRSLDLPPGSHIAVLSKNCAHFILTDLAVWMAGHVTVALYPTLNAETVAYILEHSESKLLFVGKLDTWDEMKEGVPADLPCIAFPLAPPTGHPGWDDVIADHAPIEDSPVRAADDLAIIVYTSGSTGRPKGVMHDFGPMAASSHALVKRVDTKAEDRMLSYLPLAHVMERWAVECCSLVSSFQIFFAESLDTFVQDLQRARPTMFLSVPRLWLKFQQGVFTKMPPKKLDRLLGIPIVSGIVKKKILGGLGLDSVRLAASGSAPIPADLIAWYRKLGLELLEGYGMSEDFGYSHASAPGESRVGYVGSPYDAVEVRISDDGEILVKSPGNMRGYFKEPEMTAACYTEDGFFKTGDRGERDEQGRMKITGRTKELFKTSKGKYVAPAPIENLLNTDPHVEMSCVTGSGHPQPHAVVVLGEEYQGKVSDPAFRQSVTPALEGLLAKVNAEVEHHERLDFLVVTKEPWLIENGRLTPTMKIKRGALEEAYGPQAEGWYAARQRVLWE